MPLKSLDKSLSVLSEGTSETKRESHENSLEVSKHRHRSSHAVRRYPRVHSENVFCNHPHRICMQDRLEGYEFCVDHILQDKTAPFKQCNFVSPKNGKRCTRAAPKADRKDGYCKIHTRKAALMRYKASLKAKPKDPSQELLDELDYYRQGSYKSEPDGPTSTMSKILDYASGSESDTEPVTVDQTWTGGNESDAESGDSEQEDALRHAGVYTAEEAALITRDKLIRLQSLYISQFKRLQHLMRENRRRYLANLKKEKSHYGDIIYNLTDTKDKKKLKKLEALLSYRKRRGAEALLHRKSRQRRILATQDYSGPVKLIDLPKCTFETDAGEGCGKPAFPLSSFCMNHITNDQDQVLFDNCSIGGGGICSRPAVPHHIDGTCIIHMTIPPYQPRLTQDVTAAMATKRSSAKKADQGNATSSSSKSTSQAAGDSSTREPTTSVPSSQSSSLAPKTQTTAAPPSLPEPAPTSKPSLWVPTNQQSSTSILISQPTASSSTSQPSTSSLLSNPLSLIPANMLPSSAPTDQGSSTGKEYLPTLSTLASNVLSKASKTENKVLSSSTRAVVSKDKPPVLEPSLSVTESIPGGKTPSGQLALQSGSNLTVSSVQRKHSGSPSTTSSLLEEDNKSCSESNGAKDTMTDGSSALEIHRDKNPVEAFNGEDLPQLEEIKVTEDDYDEEKMDTSDFVDVTGLSNEPSTSGKLLPKQ